MGAFELFHAGYVVISSPNYLPRGVYLAPIPFENQTGVDIWYESHPWTGPILLKVTQVQGSFTTFSYTPLTPPTKREVGMVGGVRLF